MVRPAADLYARVRHLGPEFVRFLVVGGIGTIIDLGGAAVLHSAYHVGPLASKALSITAATAVTYLGSRFWTFRHRGNQAVHREAALFIALNLAGLVVAEVVIAAATYGLGIKGQLGYNAASLIGTGLGTVFRWYAYRKWVFLAPAPPPSPRPEPAAGRFPHYAPWELDPAYLDSGYSPRPSRHSPQPWFEKPFIPNGPVPTPQPAAPVLAGGAARAATYPGPRVPGRHRKR